MVISNVFSCGKTRNIAMIMFKSMRIPLLTKGNPEMTSWSSDLPANFLPPLLESTRFSRLFFKHNRIQHVEFVNTEIFLKQIRIVDNGHIVT